MGEMSLEELRAMVLNYEAPNGVIVDALEESNMAQLWILDVSGGDYSDKWSRNVAVFLHEEDALKAKAVLDAHLQEQAGKRREYWDQDDWSGGPEPVLVAHELDPDWSDSETDGTYFVHSIPLRASTEP